MAEQSNSQEKENIENNILSAAAATEKDDQLKRFDFLMKQANIFSHFVTNGSKENVSGKRKASTLLTIENPKEPRVEQYQSPSNEMVKQSVKIKHQFKKTPSFITGEMRDYQIQGLNWLITLCENNINGILADEMGLGKTIQSIAIMGYLKNVQKFDGPFLVVAPLSTVPQWSNEIRRFCPSLRVIVLKSDPKNRPDVLREIRQKVTWDVCITSYEMFKIGISTFHRIKPWQYVIVDEAQMIKNENTLLSVCLRSIKSKNRLLLSGTPLQNNLHELWALLNYLLPDLFASSDDFDAWFDSDDCLRNEDIAKRLQELLRPFMLRRIKAEVEKSLLPKKEIKLFVGMSKVQYETYKKVLLRDVQILIAPGEYTTKMVYAILMELRKAGNHPYLIDGIESGPPYTTGQHLVDSCGKMMVLDKLLEKLKSQGSRVVLFSQFVMMLEILEDYVDWCGYKYRRLDGKVPSDKRTQDINEFNSENSDIFIFLISTKAGGLGINLATADTVIIYDSDWNPQSDFQAIDRVHRIGQTKQVRVFRLITENTVDERIVRRAEIKKRLDKMVVKSSHSLTANAREKAKTETLDNIQMVRMNAEYIFSSRGSENVLTDVDIDAILKDGELKTSEEAEKLNKMGQVELGQGMTLEDVSRPSVYEFEGIDFRTINSRVYDDTIATKRIYLPRKAKMGKRYFY